ncbi:MAG TPA: energy transducer TonB [Bacteroidia bacterium]|jgi:TonB family protein|nr:energy transducer TonB [Bacteroidia bacterium]
MSLSNLTLKGMENYGGIEIRKSAGRNTYLGFVFSVGLHALLILIYCGWISITKEDTKKIPRITYCPIFLPPILSDDAALPVPVMPKMDITRATCGIPVPIPDIEAPNQTMSRNDISLATVDGTTGEPGEGTAVNSDYQRATEVRDIRDTVPVLGDFIPDITEEPSPTEDIQRVALYPEVARQAGLEGKVTFSALIGKDGKVEKVVIEKAEYDVFSEAVIHAVMKVRFTPARQGQSPVRVWYTQTVSFKLR